MALRKSPVEIVKEGKHQLLTKAIHWQRIALKDVAKVQNGYAFSSKKFVKTGGIPLIRIRDIDKESTTDRFEGSFSEEYVVNKGDILVGMDGDFKAAYWKGEKALLNQRVCRIIHHSKTYDRKFLFLCLQPFLNAINEETSSVTVKHLSSKTIEEIPLPFPTLEEQIAIVSKIEELFSELDKGIEDLKLAQQQLKIYRQSVLQLYLTASNNVSIGSVIERMDQGWSPKCENKSSTDETEWAVIKTTAIQSGYFDEGSNKKLPDNLQPKIQHEIVAGDILITRAGPRVRVGVCCMVRNTRQKLINCDKAYRIKVNHDFIIPEYFEFIINSIKYQNEIEKLKTGISDSGLNLTQKAFLQILIPVPSVAEQKQIVQELEKRFSVADKLEEDISSSLQKAEALRQSILKQAFSGELIAEVKPVEVPKTKNEYFHQLQLVALVINGSKKKKIDHGEMTLAKNLYLLDAIYNVPTGFKYDRWHLGPYPPALKKVVNNREYFTRNDNYIEVQNEEKLLKYNNPLQAQITGAIDDLSSIFSKYKGAERSHKTELLATVCKVIEDIKSTDLVAVRESMQDWKIDLKNSKFKNKAEKFSEPETKKCIEFIIERGWEKKLI